MAATQCIKNGGIEYEVVIDARQDGLRNYWATVIFPKMYLYGTEWS